MIDWICLKCGQKLEVQSDRAGTEIPCPACGELVRLPLTQVPIPSFPPPRTPDGIVAIPGDFTAGSAAYRSESQAVLERYRRWRRRGMIWGMVPAVLVAGIVVALNGFHRSTGESVLIQVGISVFTLLCAALWGGLLGASLGTILSRWFVTHRLSGESRPDSHPNS